MENKKVELEEKRLAAEKELLTMRLTSEAEAESRKNRLVLMQGALAKGLNVSSIKDLWSWPIRDICKMSVDVYGQSECWLNIQSKIKKSKPQ